MHDEGEGEFMQRVFFFISNIYNVSLYIYTGCLNAAGY